MNIRDLMNIVESGSSNMFHGSRRRLPVGTVLRPSLSMPEPEEQAVEAILEHYRPSNCLPRNESIYLADTRDPDVIERLGGYVDHIYKVEPIGAVERNHVGWWSKILTSGAVEYADGDQDAMIWCKDLAEAYWRGEAASSSGAWEYRARSGKIVAIIGDM